MFDKAYQFENLEKPYESANERLLREHKNRTNQDKMNFQLGADLRGLRFPKRNILPPISYEDWSHIYLPDQRDVFIQQAKINKQRGFIQYA